ncbi:hypothetical protein ABZ944_41215, partial [Streptomyces flaveolus]
MFISRRIVYPAVLSIAALLSASISFWAMSPEGSTAGQSRLQTWLSQGWKDWSASAWHRKPGDFYNPTIKGHWSPDRMSDSTDPDMSMGDAATGAGVSDPEPRPVPAHPTTPPYHFTAPMVGKVFFDS